LEKWRQRQADRRLARREARLAGQAGTGPGPTEPEPTGQA
jgi:hypothetical protein